MAQEKSWGILDRIVGAKFKSMKGSGLALLKSITPYGTKHARDKTFVV